MSEKTNAMRKLGSMKISYNDYTYATTEAISGVEVAAAIQQDPARVFKTLVTRGKTANYYVFLVPVAEELDVKKAAKQVGEKSIEMIKSKELLGLTGYVHGGCSPIGMKKFFRTVIHNTAANFETIIFSGGKIGYQVELSLASLQTVIAFELADIIKEPYV